MKLIKKRKKQHDKKLKQLKNSRSKQDARLIKKLDKREKMKLGKIRKASSLVEVVPQDSQNKHESLKSVINETEVESRDEDKTLNEIVISSKDYEDDVSISIPVDTFRGDESETKITTKITAQNVADSKKNS